MTLQDWCDRWRRDCETLPSGVAVAPAKADSPERLELFHLEDYFVSTLRDDATVYLRPFPTLYPPAETSAGCAVNGWGMLR